MDQGLQKTKTAGAKFANNLLGVAAIVLAICWLRFTHWIGYMAIPPLCALYYLTRPSHHVQVGFWWIVLSFTRTGPRYEGICYCMEPCFWWSHVYGVVIVAFFCYLAQYDVKSRNMSHYGVLAFLLAFVCPSESELVTCEENHLIVWLRLVCWLCFAMLPLLEVYSSLSLVDALKRSEDKEKEKKKIKKEGTTSRVSACLFLCLPLAIWPLAIIPLLIEYELIGDLWLSWIVLCAVHLLFYFGAHWFMIWCGLGLLGGVFLLSFVRKRYTIFQFTVPAQSAEEGVAAPVAVGSDG